MMMLLLCLTKILRAGFSEAIVGVFQATTNGDSLKKRLTQSEKCLEKFFPKKGKKF